MFKTKFSVHNKIWGALPPNDPRSYGLLHLSSHSSILQTTLKDSRTLESKNISAILS